MAVSIITQQTDGGHGHFRIKAFDANCKIAGRTAAANLLIDYQHLVFFTRPAIHQLVVVGTPCAAGCLLYTSPSPRDAESSRMPSSA